MTLLCRWLALQLVIGLVAGDIEPCARKVYLAKAVQVDEKGLKCWDTVKVPSCAGQCESKEIPDWEFPFRKSYHPVCGYGVRVTLRVRLRHCDVDVRPGTELFNYVAATDCRCKVCSSERTTCEFMPPNSTILNYLYESTLNTDSVPLQSILNDV